jgi:predicted CXXCH cytochrome family protein
MKFKSFLTDTRRLSRYIRIVSILIVLLAISGVVLIVANTRVRTLAQAPTPTVLPTAATADNCASCHSEVHEVWHKGGHGDTRADVALAQQGNCLACHKEIPENSMPDPAMPNPSFTDFWADQGKPNNCLQCHVTGYDPLTATWKTDGITCEACHSPIPSNHPDDNIAVNKDPGFCRTCHTDARFGWDAWNQSAHSKNNITCSNCHDPHSTSLKPTDSSSTDASSLCENCHKEMPQNKIHAGHMESGASCVLCHVGSLKGEDDFHRVPDHDFKPKLEACNGCHAGQMHNEGKAVSLVVEQNIPAPVVAVEDPAPLVSPAPARVSPYGFAGLAAVVGISIGFIWRQIARRRSRSKASVK